MKYSAVYRFLKQASAIEDIDMLYDPNTSEYVSVPVSDKNRRIKPEAVKLLKKLVKDLYNEGVANEWIQKAEKPRKLYLHGVRRFGEVGLDPHPLDDEFYLDIRDKNDPNYRYDADAGHAITWKEGDQVLGYDG